MGFAGFVSNSVLSILRLFTVPDPTLRQPLTFSAVAPLFACYYVQAILVQLPGSRTFMLRLSLLPVIVWSGWYAATRYDFAWRLALLTGQERGRFEAGNYGYVFWIIFIVLRAVEWTFASRPYRRLRPDTSDSASKPMCKDDAAIPFRRALQDAGELFFNQRGLGWSWSLNPFPPRVAPRPLKHILLSLLLKSFIADLATYSIQYLRPTVLQSGGDTIFDPSLPPPIQYATAIYISTMAAIRLYCSVDLIYLFATLPACVLFHQSTAQWPPPSDRPWLATSIADFWGNRWHQFYSRTLRSVGSKPLYPILGRPGAVMGAFGLSALVHDWALYGLGRGTDFGTVGVFFVMMGVGILMEGVWEEGLGMGSIGGWKGWVWAMGWIVGWGTVLIEGWARKGWMADDIPEEMRVSKWVVDGLVRVVTSFGRVVSWS